MSTVKISQLPLISHINANTANTLFAGVDIPTGTTGRISVETLAQGIFENEVLKVGASDILFSNVIGQFAANGYPYLQVNLQNLTGNGSSDYVATADTGTDSKHYVNLGINGSTYNDTNYSATKLLDSYLYAQGDTAGTPGGNLVIGTATSGKQVHFIVGGTQRSNVVMTLNSTGPSINSGSYLTFADGTTQSVAAAPANYTQSAFNAANTAAANTVVIQAVNITQNNNITAVNQYAVSAYNQANTNTSAILGANAYSLQVNQYAAAAYAQANVSIGINEAQNTNIINANAYTLTVNQFAQFCCNVANSALPNTTGTFNGDLTTAGNVITNFVRSRNFNINDNTPLSQFSASANTLNPSNSGYIIHAVGKEGVTSRIALDTVGAGAVPNYLTRFARGTNFTPTPTQSGDIIGRFSSFGYGNTSFASASDARIDMGAAENFTDAAHGTSIQLWTTPISANVVRLTSSFSFGNTGLYSSNTYVSGNLTVASTTALNSVTVNGTMILANSNFSATESAITISATPNTAIPSNDGYMIHISGKNGVPARIVTDAYGTGAYALLAGRAARGTVTSPTALQSGDVIARFSGNGYGTTKYQTLGVGRIDFVAAQNFTDANTGSQIQFWNCPVGSNTLTNIATFNGDSAEFTGTLIPAKGFVYIPRILSGAQTAITINFSNDSIIKASLTADLTISLTNYVAGKVIEVWLTNTGGTARTVTHGCSATNSSENATTFNIPATSSAYIRYFSIGGDLANTFVTSIHA